MEQQLYNPLNKNFIKQKNCQKVFQKYGVLLSDSYVKVSLSNGHNHEY